VRLLIRVILAGLFGICLAGVFLSGVGQRFERAYGLGTLYALRGPVAPPEGALIVALDRASVDWLRFHARDPGRASDVLPGCLTAHARGQLARLRNAGDLPRGLHACLIEILAGRGAELIVFDILFSRPSPDDARLARAMAAAGNVVLFERLVRDPALAGPGGSAGFRRTPPRRVLADAARASGPFLLSTAANDFVEGYAVRIPGFPGLVDLAALAWRETAGGRTPPPGPEIRPIWLYGPAGTVPHRSLRAVLSRDATRPLSDDLSGRVVFVGYSDPGVPGTEDHFAVALSGGADSRIAGVELLATAYLNLRHGERMTKPAPSRGALIVFVFGLTAGALCLIRRGLGWVGVIVLALGYGGLAWFLFAGFRVWLPVAVPLYLGTALALPVAIGRRYALARALVARLAPRKAAMRMLAAAAPDRRPGRRERATVLFTDLVGSTRLGDRLAPEAYAAAMSDYYDATAAAVEAHGGLLVEFKGDGIVAVFPETDSGPEHAAKAVAAARALAAGLRRAVPPQAGGGVLRVRMGLDTGQTILGHVGAAARFDYKAIGDTVNTAARIEGHAKAIDDGHGDIALMSGATRAASGVSPGEVTDVGPWTPRGKNQPLHLWRLHLSVD